MELNHPTLLLFLMFCSHSVCSGAVPSGVKFETNTLFRSDGRGDNWAMTWSADDSVLTALCDGNWFGQQESFHTHLYRINGGPEDFTFKDLPNYPRFSWNTDSSWFGYGVIAIGETLYTTISKTPRIDWWSGPFRGFKLLKSTDNGDSWYRIDQEGNERLLSVKDPARNEVNTEEMFFLEESGRPHQEQPAYPFSYIEFVQQGRAHSASKDGYVYIYSPEGAQAHQLLLARVPQSRLGERAVWEYFTGYDPQGDSNWSKRLEDRKPVHTFPLKNSQGHYFGWYSWLPSVVWNPGLKLFIMANGGTYAGYGMTDSDEDYYKSSMHTETGSLGFWYSKNPYGPWTRFYYDEYWTVDDPQNRTYQPKLSPKWISKDGTQMVLVWSDAMRNEFGKSHTVNYMWNQMRITIELAD